MSEMILYDLELSGNCYKVRLFLSLLGQPHQRVAVDFMGGEHKASPLLDKNPFGELPVLEHGEHQFRDSQAILVYLARHYGGDKWLPTTDASEMAEVMQWLMVAENEIARGPGDARLHDLLGYDIDVATARQRAARILNIIEGHLEDRDWLTLGRATIADIACFPYIALGHQGGVGLAAYPAIRAWLGRIAALPGFIDMPGLQGVHGS